MILAGIDEAGYGPILGPMVIGCCAIELPRVGDDPDDIPCGWKALRRLVGKTRDSKGKRLHVNDSKKVYSTSIGLAELERAVLCLAATRWGEAATFGDFLDHTAAESRTAVETIDWYAPRDAEPWPHENDALNLRLRVNAARYEMERAATRIAHLHAHVLPEPQLNALFDVTRNKAATSFTFVARHLDALLNAFADGDLVIYCDRQGGREHYGELLRQMFEAWSLEVVAESPKRSEYRLTLGDRSARLIFAEQAEQQCIAVALASMLSKYLREATMRRFNAWWRAHLPELKATAGYYNDGQRFLEDIRDKCAELGIDQAVLARSR